MLNLTGYKVVSTELCYILEIEECSIKKFVLFLLQFLERMIKHNLEISLKEAYHSLWCGILISFFNEIIEVLGLHKLIHEFFVLSFKLV